MHKSLLYIGLFVAVLLGGCTDSSYRGVQEGVNDDWIEDVPVLLQVGDPNDILISKGTGAVENDTKEEWRHAGIYVYAFKRDLQTSFAVTNQEDSENCLIDGSSDELGALAGKKGKVSKWDSYVVWPGIQRAVYYKPTYQPYDFYGYYVDDMEIKNEHITRTVDAIQIQVRIDGSQDLMSSKAYLTEKQLSQDGLSDKDKVDIMNYSYSAYSARRNIQPVMYFKHHLTRLRFELYPAQEEANNVFVDSISVESRSQGLFTVVHKSEDKIGLDFSQNTEREWLPLREADGKPLRGAYRLNFKEGDEEVPLYEREKTIVGGSLLVAPDTEYKVRLYMREILESGRELKSVNELSLGNGNKGFEAGSQYAIRVSVFGALKLDIGAQLVPWGYGGEIFIDPEDKFKMK